MQARPKGYSSRAPAPALARHHPLLTQVYFLPMNIRITREENRPVHFEERVGSLRNFSEGCTMDATPTRHNVVIIIPFTISELQNQSHDTPELHKIPRSPDFEAQKLRKGR